MTQTPLPHWEEDPPDPVEVELRRLSRRNTFIGLLVVLGLVMLVYWLYVAEVPTDYSGIEDHFKYGSIGSEEGNGLPYWIWKILPDVFPEYLPDGGKGGYASLGFIYEDEPDGTRKDTPIGFSKRRMQGIIRVGLNCSVCHTATVREAPSAPRQVVPAMPAHQLDLLSYFKFIFDCAGDGRFTTENLMAQIDARTKLGPVERQIYKIAIPRTREEVLRLRGLAQFMLDHPSGPGRIDTFTPYKAVQFHFTHTGDFSVGNSDFPSIWNQQPREGMNLHWDGNNKSVFERNISAAIGAGATPVSLDLERMKRVRDWIWTLPPPKYPWKHDEALAARGAPLYKQYCAGCHGLPENQFKGGEVGQVVPIDRIRTDRERLDSYSLDLTQNQYTLGSGTSWRFTHFRKTNGYANHPLDGAWARAPYLHNGSVPTLRDLLDDAGRRPKAFYRGYDVYDQKKVGFVSNVAEEAGRRYAKYDTTVRGNGNGGHTGQVYGTDLSDGEKDALVEYLKTL